MKNVFNEILLKSKASKNQFILDKNYTYDDFYKKFNQYKELIKKNCIKRKQVILVVSNYSIEFISLIFAIQSTDHVICLVSPNASSYEINYFTKETNCKYIFSNITLSSKKTIKKKKLKDFFFYETSLTSKGIKEKDCLIIFTSGTTNKPKGVVLSLGAISSNVFSISESLNLKSNYKTIIFSPPSYAMAISQILTYMLNKLPILFINTGVKFPFDFVNKIKKFDISFLNLSISAFRILHPFLKKQKTFLRKIKFVMSGGMQMTKDVFDQFKKTFPSAFFINFYGCTENSPRISHYKFKDFTGDVVPVGKPLKGIKLKIDKKKSYLKTGEVMVSGSSLMRCYLNLPNITKAKFKKKWFKTGDLGYLDENKDLILVGRVDDSFRVGHEKLCPEEIEPLIKKKLYLDQFVIAKKKDYLLDWIPVLVLFGKKKNLSITEIYRKLKPYVAAFKIPREIIYFKKIPRTNYGKIDRKLINEKINKFKK